VWVLGAFFLLFASYAFHPDAFSYVFRSGSGRMWVSLEPAKWFLRIRPNAAFTIGLVGALALYVVPRGGSRYFGNTTPLLVVRAADGASKRRAARRNRGCGRCLF